MPNKMSPIFTPVHRLQTSTLAPEHPEHVHNLSQGALLSREHCYHYTFSARDGWGNDER